MSMAFGLGARSLRPLEHSARPCSAQETGCVWSVHVDKVCGLHPDTMLLKSIPVRPRLSESRASSSVVSASILRFATATATATGAHHASDERNGPLRFSELVSALLDLNSEESRALAALCGLEARHGCDALRTPRSFNAALRCTLHELTLTHLFNSEGDGEEHRSIHPNAYDPRTGVTYAVETARWRADFRDLAPERQMVAATIIWLYRAGSDSIWLRRVPCSWTATEALSYLYDAGVLGHWARLICTYPGW